jgi:hypothetical protein
MPVVAMPCVCGCVWGWGHERLGGTGAEFEGTWTCLVAWRSVLLLQIAALHFGHDLDMISALMGQIGDGAGCTAQVRGRS